MSWKNQIENTDFTITCGDGQSYTPLWRNSGRSDEFNASVYDFINIEGSLVDRKQAKGAKHSLLFYFDGDNHIQTTNQFRESSKDSRAWTIVHPIYGQLNGQPISISYNEDSLGITEITVDFIESILTDFPSEETSIQDRTVLKVSDVLKDSSIVFASDVQPQTEDITKLKDSNAVTASKFGSLLNNANVTEFSNAVSKSQSNADNLLNDPLSAIQSSQTVIIIPSNFESPVIDKINAYINVFNSLKETIETVADKLFFESQAAACVSAMCQSSVLPQENDYIVRTEIDEVTQTILNIYAEYLQILDDNQVQIYDVENTFIPNVNTQTQLYELVTFTTGNLYNLAFAAKQERIVYTQKNTNIYLLAHRYVGLDINDENLEQFRQINDIKLNELFLIKKGREIKYYV